MEQFIDIYCERTAPGFWDEPLNAATNAAFLLAAFCAFRLARREGVLMPETLALLLLLCAIGIGSFLFHTAATALAQLADVLPILLFQIVFIFTYARRVMAWDPFGIAALLGLFFGLTLLSGMVPPALLNGSAGYAPALAFLAGLGLWHCIAGRKAPYSLLWAAKLFAVSLVFRTVDMMLCPLLPWGLHFIWHMLNAGVLYLALRALVLNLRAQPDALAS